MLYPKGTIIDPIFLFLQFSICVVNMEKAPNSILYVTRRLFYVPQDLPRENISSLQHDSCELGWNTITEESRQKRFRMKF